MPVLRHSPKTSDRLFSACSEAERFSCSASMGWDEVVRARAQAFAQAWNRGGRGVHKTKSRQAWDHNRVLQSVAVLVAYKIPTSQEMQIEIDNLDLRFMRQSEVECPSCDVRYVLLYDPLSTSAPKNATHFGTTQRICTGMESRRDNGRMPMYSKKLLRWEEPVEHTLSEGEKVAHDEAESSQKRV